MTQASTVCVLPFGRKLGAFPGSIALDSLIWPLGQPDHLRGKQLRHLSRDDHFLVSPSSSHYYRLGFGTRAKVSIVIFEPQAIHGRHIEKLRRHHRRFHRVLSAAETELVAQIPNGIFFPFGSTWIDTPEALDLTKTKTVSLIASAKRSQPGHLIRHDIIDWARQTGLELDALGGGYQPFKDKYEGLAPYRFSVVIENAFEDNYFTEKLIDAILCRTVPIYLGCPNIDRFMDTSGMILCQSAEDIQKVLPTLNEELYQAKLPGLMQIQKVAADYGDIWTRAARALLQDSAAR